MLYYNGTDVSKEIDFNKTNESKEYNIWHYGYWNKDFINAKNLDNISVLNINSVHYHCIISRISKS